jgi:hypothetical protein
MQNKLLKKGIIVGIIVLFIGASLIVNIGGSNSEKQNITKIETHTSGLGNTIEVNEDDYYLRDGLVGYWNFNEGKGTTCYDESECGNYGTIYGANWTKGITSKALIFDGVDDYVEIADNDSLDLTTNITISAWINATSSQTAVNPRIICKYMHPFSGYSLNIDADDSDHNLLFEFRDINSNWHGVHGTTSLNDERWHHVVGTFNGTTINVYVDGMLENTLDNESFLIKKNNNSMRIGQTPNVPENQIFKGIIDEVFIYNRSLNENEIKYLYYLPCLKNSLLFGTLNNLTSHGPYLTINSKSILYIRIFPPTFKIATVNDDFIISNCYHRGFVGPKFIIGNFKAMEV